MVAVVPDISRPTVQPVDLESEVGKVGTHENHKMTTDRVEGLGAAQDAADDLVEGRVRAQEEP
jgi:hypothetical protein